VEYSLSDKYNYYTVYRRCFNITSLTSWPIALPDLILTSTFHVSDKYYQCTPSEHSSQFTVLEYDCSPLAFDPVKQVCAKEENVQSCQVGRDK
jgi:hypothetical protein